MSNYALEDLFRGQILSVLHDRFDIYNCTGVDVTVQRCRPSFVTQCVLQALMENNNEFPVVTGNLIDLILLVSNLF